MKRLFILLATATLLVSCERPAAEDPRQAFVGDYDFVSTGNIDIYADSLKLFSLPMDKTSEMKLSPAEKDNELWLIAEGDSTIARLSDGRLFIDPATEQRTYGGIVLTLSYTYSPATLENDRLSLTSTVEISATHKDRSLSGRGQVDIVATKKP